MTINTCDAQVYENGITVALVVGVSADNIEKYVQEIAKRSEQKVDWHYFGGRAVIKTIGDTEKVVQALCDGSIAKEVMSDEADHLTVQLC